MGERYSLSAGLYGTVLVEESGMFVFSADKDHVYGIGFG